MLVQKRPRQDLMRHGGLWSACCYLRQSAEAQEKVEV